jgi:hypothetical protein
MLYWQRFIKLKKNIDYLLIYNIKYNNNIILMFINRNQT